MSNRYQIDEIIVERKCGVRVSGTTDYISKHDTKKEAQKAVQRYEAVDRRRKKT